jgi:acetyl-CoA carboxylase biotin carboxyl carrier protein
MAEQETPNTRMTFDEIKQLLEIVREHELWEFELEREDFKIRVRRGGVPAVSLPGLSASEPAGAVMLPPAAPPPLPAAAGSPAAASTPPAADDSDLEFAVVKSPIVGTFYRSAEPGAAPFVQVGDTIRKNQVLCIIEAMKLMNEITSEYEGEIVKIYVENGQAVQYGERLFAIRAA